MIRETKKLVSLLKLINRRIINRLSLIIGSSTSKIRVLPDFIIIGGMRCGTSSLFNYLNLHPYIKTSRTKEIHFFDRNFGKGINWYKSFFPSLVYKWIMKMIFNQDVITGEASPNYLFDPRVPKRISMLIPNTKLILLLRNPVYRTYSNYNYNVKNNKENKSFRDSIKNEKKFLDDNLKGEFTYENYKNFENGPYRPYLMKSIYIKQIKNWTRYFPKNQILIIKSEDLFLKPQYVLAKVFNFLNIPNYQTKKFKLYNYLNYPDIKPDILDFLFEYFEPFNQDLYKFLNRNFNWKLD